MSARPDPFKVHVADQVLAAFGEAGRVLSTPQLEVATGYSPRYGQLVYHVLTALASRGEVEKVTRGGHKPCYWRRLAPVIALPPMTTTDQGRPS